MLKSKKYETIEELKSIYADNSLFVVLHYNKLNIVKMTTLRNNLRSAGAKLRVVKNTFASISSKETQMKDVANLFRNGGAIALAYSEKSDPVAVTKVIYEFQKENLDYLKVLGGLVYGRAFDEEKMKHVVNMPSIDQLCGQLVGVLNSPIQSLLRVLSAPMSKLVGVLDIHSNNINNQ